MGDVLTEGVCFDTSLARGEWGIAKPTIPILGRSAWASRATTAWVGGYSLLAVFVYVADEHPTTHAGVGAKALQAGVVRLYSVVVIVSGWVRLGCARLCGVHSERPSSVGRAPGCSYTCGAISFSLAHVVSHACNSFTSVIHCFYKENY